MKKTETKKTNNEKPVFLYKPDDTRKDRLHDVETDRGFFRFKDNRKGES